MLLLSLLLFLFLFLLLLLLVDIWSLGMFFVLREPVVAHSRVAIVDVVAVVDVAVGVLVSFALAL
eukprot:15477573-Alexandrium_andersonii.AAC.1